MKNMSVAARALKISKEGGMFGAVTDRTLAGLRLLLAISALVIIVVDPAEPDRFRNLTHGALVAYIVYSSVIFMFSRHHVNFPWRVMQAITWGDVLWYSALITLGNGTNAVFFFFYLFAIIAGSSRGGTRLGLTLTVVCTSIFIVLNLLLLESLRLDVARFGRRAVYMAALGYILAYWGGAEAILRKKLTFLKELSLVANPRFGVDHTIRQMLRRLGDYYHADYCFFLIEDTDAELDFYRVMRGRADAESRPMKIPQQSGIPLMNSSESTVAVFASRVSLWNKKSTYKAWDPKTQEQTDLPPDSAMDTAEFLSVRSFITAPLRYRERIRGRVLVGSKDVALFTTDDAAFLQQAADQVLPLIESIRLVDRLASEAAEEERRKIARSVHDRVIQPYLGLQIGLKALQQELSPSTGGSSETGPQITDRGAALLDRLVTMTREGIEELRQYVTGLRSSHAEEATLVHSIRRFAEKFESATGIHVEVLDEASGLTMNDRLSAELFQMTAEALSNIHRHTQSRNARVKLALVENNLELSVENDNLEEVPTAFRPASILERAEALGARAEVLWPAGKTLVRVGVPL